MMPPDSAFQAHTFSRNFSRPIVAPVWLLALHHLPLDHHLGRDAGMVGAGLPQHVAAAHALEAAQHVLQRVVERVPHVQRAGDVGRRNDDAIGRPPPPLRPAGAERLRVLPRGARCAPRYRPVGSCCRSSCFSILVCATQSPAALWLSMSPAPYARPAWGAGARTWASAAVLRYIGCPTPAAERLCSPPPHRFPCRPRPAPSCCWRSRASPASRWCARPIRCCRRSPPISPSRSAPPRSSSRPTRLMHGSMQLVIGPIGDRFGKYADDHRDVRPVGAHRRGLRAAPAA